MYLLMLIVLPVRRNGRLGTHPVELAVKVTNGVLQARLAGVTFATVALSGRIEDSASGALYLGHRPPNQQLPFQGDLTDVVVTGGDVYTLPAVAAVGPSTLTAQSGGPWKQVPSSSFQPVDLALSSGGAVPATLTFRFAFAAPAVVRFNLLYLDGEAAEAGKLQKVGAHISGLTLGAVFHTLGLVGTGGSGGREVAVMQMEAAAGTVTVTLFAGEQGDELVVQAITVEPATAVENPSA